MLHRWGFFLFLGCIAIFTGEAMAGAYYGNSYSYQEYKPKRSYRKSYSPKPRYYNYSSQQYSPNRAYKKRNRRQYRPISSYKRNFLPERVYIGASLGHTIPLGFEMNPGSIRDSRGTATYGILSGINISDWFRLGIDLTHHHQYTVKDKEDKTNLEAQIEQTTIMLNSYLTLPQYMIKPYILVGLGLSYNRLSDYSVDGQKSNYPNGTNTDFAYQIGAGITFPYKKLALDGEIKYANKGKVQTKSGVGSIAGSPPRKAKLEDIVFTISARYYFNDTKP
jgi:hypothetical protein